MKKYDVYGLGNALVDIEYQVAAEQLAELGIDKGVMTLVERDRQRDVMAVLGESHHRMACGGSAANTVIAVTQFGGDAFYSCKVANDDVGTFFLGDLASHGAATNITRDNREAGVTGTCLVFVTPDADRTMNTHLGISEELDEHQIIEDEVQASQYLYIEGYLSSSVSARRAVARAREAASAAGTRIALTLSDPNMVTFFRDALSEMIGDGVDLLFANESEALLMAGAATLDEALQYLQTIAKSYAVTRGADGAVVCDGEQRYEVASSRVEAVDTVGAGDMFAGAFLYGVTHGMGFAEAGDLACRSASSLVTEFGPRMDTERVQTLLARGGR